MSNALFFAIALVEAGVLGGTFLLFPRFARRGLLFGVYVGEQTSGGPEARRITLAWYQAMAVWLAVSVALEVALGTVVPKPVLVGLFPLVLVAGVFVLYFRAYRQAQQFAIAAPARAVALLRQAAEPSLALPIAALLVGLAGGIISIVYSASVFPQLPDRIPTHFGITGMPDAWHAKSFSSVMTTALMTLVIGVGLGGVAILTARAKRAVRVPFTTLGMTREPAAIGESETEISLHAQLRFRRAMTRLISTIALLVTVMMTSLNIATIQVALGHARGLPWFVLAPVAVILVLGLGGSLYIGLRYGQGGSRLEREVAAAPLTNGLADNRYWVLGAFYVNRDDPSFMVEDRFGLGYTLNFGNRKAVGFFVGLLAAIVALAIGAVVFM